MFSRIRRRIGGLDFVVHGVAFAPREDLIGGRSSRPRARAFAWRSTSAPTRSSPWPRRAAADADAGGGSILTLTYLGSDRVFPNYNVMGVAKAALEVLGALPGRRSGPAEHPRQRDLRRPDEDARGRGHRRLLGDPASAASARPCERTIDTSEVGDAAAFLLGPAARGITGEVLMVDAGYHVMGM